MIKLNQIYSNPHIFYCVLRFGGKREQHFSKLDLLKMITVESWLMTSSILSRDPCVFYRPECIFADVIRIGKMTSSINSFCQGDLLVKISSWSDLLIPRYSMILIFPNKFWSVNSGPCWLWAYCACSEVTWRVILILKCRQLNLAHTGKVSLP